MPLPNNKKRKLAGCIVYFICNVGDKGFFFFSYLEVRQLTGDKVGTGWETAGGGWYLGWERLGFFEKSVPCEGLSME